MKDSTSRLYRLDEIAIHKLLLNVSQIQDIGTTPPHLLLPIFAKMTYKQLDSLEQKQPLIKQYSDLAWKHLISKDFPNYHFENNHKLSTNNYNYRATYFKYFNDLNKFKLDSISRLRKKNENLQNSKSKIIVLPHLREPIRKSSSRITPYRPNSFVDKIKQDVSFKNKLVYSKPYIQDWQLNQFTPKVRHLKVPNNRRIRQHYNSVTLTPTIQSPSPRPVKSAETNTRTGENVIKPRVEYTTNPRPRIPNATINDPPITSTETAPSAGAQDTTTGLSCMESNKVIPTPTPTPTTILPIKPSPKRRPPSIFLPNKRQLTKPIFKRKTSNHSPSTTLAKAPLLKPIKSSIFQ